jgi:hypothetical protein
MFLPMATMSGVPVGPMTQGAVNLVSSSQAVLSQKLNTTTETQAPDSGEALDIANIEAKAKAIDAYFESKNMPLAGHGKGMVLAAEKYDLDWRLLAAISVRETTGGREACPKTYARTGDIGYKYNVFGWGSCKMKFQSYEHGFEVLARNLSGSNPNTAHYYDNKTTIQILRAYNPPSIVPKYAEQVISIMDNIGQANLGQKPSEA